MTELKTTVVCMVCGREFKAITRSHLNEKHEMTPEQYDEKFPDANRTSEATRDKVGQRTRGKKQNAEHTAKIAAALKGRPLSEEHKQAVSRTKRANFRAKQRQENS